MSITKDKFSVFICTSNTEGQLRYGKPIAAGDAEDVVAEYSFRANVQKSMEDLSRLQTPFRFKLKDMTEYSIKLLNHAPRRARAKVFIDGKEVVTVLIEPGSLVEIRRPFADAKLFTFVVASDESPKDYGDFNPHLGKVRVEFDLEVLDPLHRSKQPVDNTIVVPYDIASVQSTVPMMCIGDRPYGIGGGTVYCKPCYTQGYAVSTGDCVFGVFNQITIDAMLVPE